MHLLHQSVYLFLIDYAFTNYLLRLKTKYKRDVEQVFFALHLQIQSYFKYWYIPDWRSKWDGVDYNLLVPQIKLLHNNGFEVSTREYQQIYTICSVLFANSEAGHFCTDELHLLKTLNTERPKA